MDKSQTLIQQLKDQAVLPLFFHYESEVCLGVMRSLYDAGIRSLEFTNRGKSALDNFKALVAERDKNMKDLYLAVGTIRTADQANQFMDAGADYLISPVFDAAICDAAYMNKVLWIPGCMTPTEIHVAENAGCTLVKLFPGNVLGPDFVAAINTLFPNVDFMPTGGVEPEKENLEEWFAAGVCAVGMGSRLVSKKILEEKDYKGLRKKTKKLLDIIASIK